MLRFLRDLRSNKPITLFLLALILLIFFGIWLLLYSTPRGLGLNDDSIAYIAGARSLMSGQGFREAWLVSNGPMIHFPPGFPGMLALIGIVTGIDPLRGARALNAVLFGLNIGLAGWLGWRMTGSRTAGLVVAMLTLLSSSLLYVHSRAMSEPLYIFLTLLAFVILDLYFERAQKNTPHTLLLIFLGFVLGWAYLARYAAVSLLATMLSVLLVLHKDWRKRLTSAGILILSTIPWIVGWSIRNRVVGGSFTNRQLSWHPVSLENWELGVATLAEFFIPLDSWRRSFLRVPGLFEGILIVIGLSLLVWVLVNALPLLFGPSQPVKFGVLAFSNVLYIIVYLTVLITTMTLFDSATKFQVRILSPTYISLLLLLITIVHSFWRRKRIVWKPAVALLAVGLLAISAYSQNIFVEWLRKSGGTFAKERWSELEAFTAIQQFPEDVLILTNEPGVVYLYTGRPSGVLPKSEPGITNIKQPVLDGDIVIVLFRVNRANDEMMDYYYQLGRGLYQTDYSSTWIFSAFPE